MNIINLESNQHNLSLVIHLIQSEKSSCFIDKHISFQLRDQNNTTRKFSLLITAGVQVAFSGGHFYISWVLALYV